MEPLDIKKYPDGILRKTCTVVTEITPREITLFDEMIFTMRHFSGIGLAAPQIGSSRCLIVADIGEGAIKLANPVVLKAKGKTGLREGCLSLPGIIVDVERREKIVVSGLNEKGKRVEIEAKGLLARVLQHEIDHLKGKLIIDYLTLLEKLKAKAHKTKKCG